MLIEARARAARALWAALSAMLLAACSVGSATHDPSPTSSGGARLAVMSTISTFDSFITSVGGAHVEVSNLVPVGSGPEDYQPTPEDIERLARAQILVENGLGLEAWLAHTIDNAKNPDLHVVVCTDGLPVKGVNPHLWMDPELARGYVAKIRDALAAADPADASEFRANAAKEDGRLLALEREIRARLASIPPASRAMIVFHNAWQYFDDRFGLRTLGVLELSPGQEPDPNYVADLIALAERNHVRAIFAEPEYSPKLVQTLAESAHIRTVQNLYDDSLATSGPVHDYDSMLRYDAATIATALSGKP
jgi:ABC-type Zn uptake system ZnuABC Zn-binding protein ZnuA